MDPPILSKLNVHMYSVRKVLCMFTFEPSVRPGASFQL